MNTNTEKLSYIEFTDRVRGLVEQLAGGEATVVLSHVLKNNSVRRDSITIHESGAQAAPSIYINDLYTAYLNGETEESIAEGIVRTHRDNLGVVDAEQFSDFTFESMRGSIICRLINYDMNRELLAEVPHIRYRDLAVTFHCLVDISGHSMGTVRIKNEHCTLWGVSAPQLYAEACINMPRLLPYTFKSMLVTLSDMLVTSLDGESAGSAQHSEIEDMIGCLENCSEMEENAMYVLSTESGISGAACLLYDGVTDMIADRIGGSYYILPSSINEVIIVPDSLAHSRRELEEMVRTVNRENVPREDILSDTVYHYPEDDFTPVI